MARDFQIIIVGGGIAGLTAATALRRWDRTITVLERSRMLSETGALISLQPNASKIVSAKWKLDSCLELAEPQVDSGFRLFDIDGKLVHDIQLSTAQFGTDRVLYHRQDLHVALKTAALSTDRPGKPAVIKTACSVVSCDPDAGAITLSSGEMLKADLVIGADGIKSVLRTAVLGREHKAIPTGVSAYRILVPVQTVQDIEGVPGSVKQPYPAVTTMVVGHDRRVIMGPGRGGKLFGIVALVPDKEAVFGDDSDNDSWVRHGLKKDLLESYKDFPVWLRAIFDASPDDGIGLWQLRDIDPLPTWMRGRTILIGDAAHAMLPTQGQGASQSIEDVEALQAFFDDIDGSASKEQVQAALQKVFDSRYQRVSLIQAYSREQAKPGTAKGSNAVNLDPGEFMQYNCEYDGAVDWLKKQDNY